MNLMDAQSIIITSMILGMCLGLSHYFELSGNAFYAVLIAGVAGGLIARTVDVFIKAS
ncbi:hypothetical protein [Pseudovibrio sp. POLY-S9]|uniref:hypothetical protein n=1 Tax=Pseudovibrio sp. POLY-S9 TaxID=1576596 RepID=UPI000AFD567D|nr:hypothetical protein [Pseudovibrio sp. POLY-S9]